ncbi:uncharacterized protein LOC113238424 [Hyposmocoma kahamanoa]|uniref:uncharacterized protein LOC113238424 n=1 Tax=Hyposmocoma kahamanoa TaxID=1477025 RepID=UPI000E6D7010|nr:uncharacterized protein LOC113238424 [Hyposmocoma kahamanoa]
MSAYKESAVLEYLEFVDLSYNELRHDASEMYTAATMPRLRTIILDHNSGLDICRLDYFTGQSTIREHQHSDLIIISASFTGTSRLCFGLMKRENLHVFNISYSVITTLSLQELPASTAPNFIMDLRGNNITNIQFFGTNEYEATKSRFIQPDVTKTTVLANLTQMQCDCQYWWLQKALNDISNLRVQDITCSDGIQLIHQERTRLNCTKFDCGDCVCRRYATSTTANCSSGQTVTIPMVEGLSHLHAASNRIESLNASLFSDKLVWVDVSANGISRLDSKTIKAMFSKEDRHFKLVKNKIFCDCTNKVLLKNFRLHRHQVNDKF